MFFFAYIYSSLLVCPSDAILGLLAFKQIPLISPTQLEGQKCKCDCEVWEADLN